MNEKIYEQLCLTYRAIDDFRSKLLGFLPLASAGGALFLLNNALVNKDVSALAKAFLGPIGLFGFIITLGLYCYELYGIRKCHALIEAGKALEYQSGVREGQFAKRPRNVLFVINEPFAAGIIYPAVMAAWMFLARLFAQPELELPAQVQSTSTTAAWVFAVGFVASLVFNLTLPYHEAMGEWLDKHLPHPSKGVKTPTGDSESAGVAARQSGS